MGIILIVDAAIFDSPNLDVHNAIVSRLPNEDFQQKPVQYLGP